MKGHVTVFQTLPLLFGTVAKNMLLLDLRAIVCHYVQSPFRCYCNFVHLKKAERRSFVLDSLAAEASTWVRI